MRFMQRSALASALLWSVSLSLTAYPAKAQLAADPDARAAATERQMTDAERFQLLYGIMPVNGPWLPPVTIPPGSKPSAGYVPGVPRLGVPALRESDASLGVANWALLRKDDVATAMPSATTLAASFNADLAYRSGAMIAGEARAKGFNVLLAGGINLTREPRNGRNFEYLGEDPLLAGVLGGESIRGIQSRNVISTVKHFSLNVQETLRTTLDARIAEPGHRESDLLAFQIAIERGQPGSVMCAYNKVNGAYACGNDPLLNGVLKREWGYKGWVMSDWGAVHDVAYFAAGLDQQSGAQLDKQIFFGAPLQAEIASGNVPKARVSDAVRRILRSIYAVGADWPVIDTKIDYAANAKVAREVAQQGIVVLKNDGILPLAKTAKTILVVGGNAHIGVMSGAGSSQVTPVGGATILPVGGPGIAEITAQQMLIPSSPVKALRAVLPGVNILYDSGYATEMSIAFAGQADMVIVFATHWETEGADQGLTLPAGQNALISAVAKANPNTVVVLETGNPVLMPWLDDVKGVVEAWYPGQEGGPAIADILTGAVNPSGRLPFTFPASEAQNPRPQIAGYGDLMGSSIAIDYKEGSDIGYRWFAANRQTPLFPFGHGLSYTRFEHGTPVITADRNAITARLTTRNIGARGGADVPQLYLLSRGGKEVKRLVAFGRVELAPGKKREVTVDIEPRVLADWVNGKWQIDAGEYRFALGKSADDLGPIVTVRLPGRRW